MSDGGDCFCEEVKCPPKGAPAWVVTFGDMMSLLLCFFVLLLSFSTTDVVKYKKMMGSMKDAFGLAATDPVTDMPSGNPSILPQIQIPQTFSALVTVRAKASRLDDSSSELEMESGADWVRIKVDGDALFASGDFQVRSEAHKLLNEIADLINDFDGVVTIEGHTDGDPPRATRFEPGSYLGNYELALMRSVAVLGYMVANKSVDKLKLMPVSFGEVKPRESNEFPEGKAKNRRVEFEFRASAKSDVDSAAGEIIRPQ